MILLDTHIWVWWVNQGTELSSVQRDYLLREQGNGLGVSIISCWEIAKLVQLGRLQFTIPVAQWLDQALSYPGIQLLDLSLPIVIESTQLPGNFHRDPADQMIVATARVHDIPLMTADGLILNYPHVKFPKTDV
jgi:PIN domain nuclease of toxin-antitoxin system